MDSGSNIELAWRGPQGCRGLDRRINCSICWIQVHKTYRTLVGGRLEGQGYVDIPLDGKPSLTEYRSVSQTASGNHGWISTLELLPHTGMGLPYQPTCALKVVMNFDVRPS